MVKFQLPPALAHAAHRVCATCPQKLRPCAPRPPLCALAPTLRRGAGRSSSTRFRAGCALEGQQLPLLLMRSQVDRSEEHTSELQSLMRISYAVFCSKKTKMQNKQPYTTLNNIT